MKKLYKIMAGLVLLNTLVMLPSLFLPRQRPPALDALAGSESTGQKMLALFSLLRDQNYVWLSAELLAAVTIILLFKKIKKAILVPLITLILALVISYETYEVIIIRFFMRQPMWTNDSLLFADGLNLLLDLWSNHWVIILSAVLAIMVLFFLLIPKLVGFLIAAREYLTNKAVHAGVLFLLASMWLAIYLLYGHDQRFKDREGLAQSTVARMLYNRQLSVQYRNNLRKILSQPVDSTYFHYDKIKLRQKPDVYFFFVESYGRILYDEPVFRQLFTVLADSFLNTVEKSGRRIVSNFSRSPIIGGGSWMSIATTIGGIKIDDQSLFSRYTSKPRPNMASFFHNQGYTTFLLQPNTRSKPARPIINQYGFDRMLFYNEMNYSGRHYGYGMVPDQYSLNYSFEQYVQPQKGPAFLFFMTVTPHAPWSEVAPVSARWQEFGTRQEKPTDEFAEIRRRIKEAGIDQQNYMLAIAHDLLVIRDFIARIPDDALFVLLGDHQPPIGNGTAGGFETPMHIICNDEKLLKCFGEFGFENGMIPTKDPQHYIRHEAVFSILANALSRRYGQGDFIATVLPEGANLSLLKETD